MQELAAGEVRHRRIIERLADAAPDPGPGAFPGYDRPIVGPDRQPRQLTDLSRRELIQTGLLASGALWLPFTPRARAALLHERAPHARVRTRALRELRRRLRGPLLLPGDHAYAAASEPANAQFDRVKPLAVARCANERDIATCIDWAREHDVQPVARGSGHSYGGFSTTSGLVVDLSRLNRVVVDPRDGTAIVGGAASNRDVFKATHGGEFVLPAGTCPSVCVGGLVLGGGIGYNTRWAGLTSDHLIGSTLITADAKRLELSRSGHRDLFWACRGGAGGSFGINSSFSFRLAKIPRKKVAFYRFNWRGADAASAVLAAFDRMLERAPSELNAIAFAQAEPIGAGGPRKAISVYSRGQYLGPLHELRELVAPLLAAATPTATKLTTMPYWDMQRIFSSEEEVRHSWGDISRYSKAPLPDAVYAKLVDLLADCPSRTKASTGSMWSLGWVGGDVVDRIGRRETAYVHRDVMTLLRATSTWAADAPASVGRDLLAWTKQMIEIVAPHTPPESYQNFPSHEIRDWKRQYYGENYRRLAAVKRRYDPDDLFHNAQSIRP